MIMISGWRHQQPSIKGRPKAAATRHKSDRAGIVDEGLREVPRPTLLQVLTHPLTHYCFLVLPSK
jgi:hypothetical protein